jgi:hypothetical protein
MYCMAFVRKELKKESKIKNAVLQHYVVTVLGLVIYVLRLSCMSKSTDCSENAGVEAMLRKIK